MNRRNPLSIFQLIALLPLQNPTAGDKIVRVVGTVAAYAAMIGVVLNIQTIVELSDATQTSITAVVGPSFLIYVLCAGVLGIRSIGESKQISGFGAQTRDIARHLFWYGLLPALVIAAVIWGAVASGIIPSHYK